MINSKIAENIFTEMKVDRNKHKKELKPDLELKLFELFYDLIYRYGYIKIPKSSVGEMLYESLNKRFLIGTQSHYYLITKNENVGIRACQNTSLKL